MHRKIHAASGAVALLLSASALTSWAAHMPPGSPQTSGGVILLAPDSANLDFDSAGRIGGAREASTLVRVQVTGASAGGPPCARIFATFSGNEAMRPSGRGSAVLVSSVRIMNSQGDWVTMKPLAEIGGQSGVLVAAVSGTSGTFRLRVRLQLEPGQHPGKYLGFLTLEAH